ncbi:gamma-glutamylcyclotransferase [Bartonella sp. HY038]|uniref:gamma-glutamylcyclotransferase n=1 Tax=Bartonella sp. HY038 TaxID=2759660 RepID=UPI0015FAA4F6|nr:gamma-glutamylcyclotransferase [Bartonella sp. HY038]
MDSFWVFGYGSLMWNPGFVYEEAKLCRLHGYHRSFCIYSTHYRGTVEQPGLVLGLKKGGSCLGLGFKIAEEHAQKTYDYLVEREQVTGVYKEKHLNLYFDDHSHNHGLAFVADPLHEQYAEKLDLQSMADLISKAAGIAGKNADYALNTVERLQKIGIHDRQLTKLAQILKTST